MRGCHTTNEHANSKNERFSSGLSRPCNSILRKPAHRGRGLWSHSRFGSSLEVQNFSGPVWLFLVAGGAPEIEDLGFSLGRFCPVARRPLRIAYDGGYWNWLFAMKAYHSAKCWAFGFNRHLRSSQRLGFRSWGSPQSYSKGSSRVQSHEKQELWKYRGRTMSCRIFNVTD